MQTSIILQISIAISVILATVIYFISSTSKKQRVLLVGPTASGKTSIGLNKLSKTKNSVRTSAAINFISLETTVLVDIPGHERVCFDYLRQQLTQGCDRVLYCIDHKQIQHSVSHFNSFLGVLEQYKKPVEYIILLTKVDKVDKAESLTIQRAKNALEFELNKMRKSSVDSAKTTSLANVTILTSNHHNLSRYIE